MSLQYLKKEVRDEGHTIITAGNDQTFSIYSN